MRTTKLLSNAYRPTITVEDPTADSIKQLSQQVTELKSEFQRFVEHFKCFEHTSADPRDSIAFIRARAVLNKTP